MDAKEARKIAKDIRYTRITTALKTLEDQFFDLVQKRIQEEKFSCCIRLDYIYSDRNLYSICDKFQRTFIGQLFFEEKPLKEFRKRMKKKGYKFSVKKTIFEIVMTLSWD